MKNISFDNPYLLLLIIPLAACILVPYFIVKNKDNRSTPWLVSVVAHVVIVTLAALAIAGLSSVAVLSETTVYVLADVSHSSERNLDKIDEYISEMAENLPERTRLGVVCFGKNCVITTSAGRKLVSVRDSGVDASETDTAGALRFVDGLFEGDSLKRVVLITDGNDTVSESAGSIAAAVEQLRENGVIIDAIFLDNTLTEDEDEMQLLEVAASATTYLGNTSTAKALIRSSINTQAKIELYVRLADGGDAPYTLLSQSVIAVEKGLTSVSLALPADTSAAYEYKVVLVSDRDISPFNNERCFIQTVVGQKRVLLIGGSTQSNSLISSLYGSEADIDAYTVTSSGTRVPFKLEDLVEYDEIVLSDVDVRNIRNVNAFIDSLDMVVSAYGKSLITLGDLLIQTNADDTVLKKLSELLPVTYGSTKRDGRLYTIVMDVSHSMFMASKLTSAKQAAVQLISVLDPEDYICFVQFSGDVKVKTAQKVKDCKDELIKYIMDIDPSHGTDIGLGLEEALKTVKALNLSENHVMLISDGFSFRNQYDAEEIAAELKSQGATVSALCTYVPADGNGGRDDMNAIARAGGTNGAYIVSRPEDVGGVVFGQMGPDIGDVIIRKDSAVRVAKHNDRMVAGISALSNVSGFLLSLEKYDATVPLTVTYQKDNGYQETVPLYAYRSHGNGRVATFTSSLSDGWTRLWSADERELFINNLFESNTPTVRIDRPFELKLEYDGRGATVTVVPSVLNPAARTVVRITTPNGRTVTRTLSFDAKQYSYSFATGQIGNYRVEVTYSYDESSFTDSAAFHLAYTEEYDEFAVCDKFNIYAYMRGNGEIYTDGVPGLENDEDVVTTYKQSYVIPLLIAAVVLFVADVFVRKLRVKRRAAKR